MQTLQIILYTAQSTSRSCESMDGVVADLDGVKADGLDVVCGMEVRRVAT
jgi:hypothetical protein